YDIYAQRINSSGAVQWTSNGISVSTAGSYQYTPTIVSDGSGGAIITWYDYRNGNNNSDIYAQKVDALGYLGIVNPTLSSVEDINGDQGGEVSINWNASAYDIQQQKVITYYSIWRGIEPSAALSEKQSELQKISLDFTGKAYRTINNSNGPTYWEWLGNIPGHYLSNYSFTANTLLDSSASGNYFFKFFVSAQTEDPFVFWDSNIDSGYSVDNLSPFGPQDLVAKLLPGNNVELTWSKNKIDPDLKNYIVYRSVNSGFIPDETTLLSSLNDTIFIDTNVPSNG
ncbi:MAG: hypothetical protein ACXWCZ_14225, partial [Flavisolibacter sp.]